MRPDDESDDESDDAPGAESGRAKYSFASWDCKLWANNRLPAKMRFRIVPEISLKISFDAMLICRSVQMFSEKLIEEKIREAMEKGEFDNLPGKGKPLDLDAYFATPADLRLGYSVLKSAGCAPVEVELQNEIDTLKARLGVCNDDRERQALRKEIEGKTLKLNLLMDSNQRARRGRKA
jgi:hypothetical protein